MDLTLKPEVINADDLTAAIFNTRFKHSKSPLVIKGFTKQFPAGDLWNFDYFKEKLGDRKVGVFDNKIKRNTAYITPDLHLPFSEFIDIIQKDEETSYRLFLFDLFKEYPDLRKDFPTPDIMKGLLGNIGFCFFGGKNTSVRFHYDIDASNVLMTQVLGRKQVVLISPEYNKLIYRVPYSSFSLVDLENPDYESFPGLKYIKGYNFILNPGDALFMPSRYWHFNTYLEGGMAISYRSLSSSAKDVITGLLNTTTRIAFDKTMDKIMHNKWFEIKTERAQKLAKDELKRIATQ